MSKANPIDRRDYFPAESPATIRGAIGETIEAYIKHVSNVDTDRLRIVMNEWVFLILRRSVGDPTDEQEVEAVGRSKISHIEMVINGIITVPSADMTDKAFELMEVQEQ